MARFHTRYAKATVVQVYAPTEVAADSEKDELYYQLQGVIDEIPSFDIKLVIFDFNTKLSGDRRAIPTSIGPHGSADDINDNGERLLSLCSTSGISIGNTFFKHKRIHKNTWTSQDGNTSNEIDYTRWRSSLQDVRAYRGADIGSDHNLDIGKIHLKLKKATTSGMKKTYATERLKELTASENFPH